MDPPIGFNPLSAIGPQVPVRPVLDVAGRTFVRTMGKLIFLTSCVAENQRQILYRGVLSSVKHKYAVSVCGQLSYYAGSRSNDTKS
jgi:hypothetical protein